ncbi:MAG: WD40/YVTN/BNR-like repeat-containing protein [Ardenticatenaceae bacterium]
MDNSLFVATANGFWRAERVADGWQAGTHTLRGRHVTSVVAREGLLLAGTTDGLFRSADGGESWQEASRGLGIRHVRWLALHPERSERVFAGTEPAGIFVSHDGGGSWRECPEVGALRDEHDWYLPYSPQAGCVREFAFHGSDRVYAAVEVGGVLSSHDGGDTWQLVGGSTGDPWLGYSRKGVVHPDVHSMAVHPSSPDLLFAPTGGGFYGSTDGGQTWRTVYRKCYCRAVWVDPADPNHLILGTANSVDRYGRIEETHDGGRGWARAMVGLNGLWRHHMVDRFTPLADHLFAVLSNGDLLAAPLSTLAWQRILPDLSDVKAVAAA